MTTAVLVAFTLLSLVVFWEFWVVVIVAVLVAGIAIGCIAAPIMLIGKLFSWSRVDKTGDCWIWRGRLTQNGYGWFHRMHGWKAPRMFHAHRAAYMLEVGPIPPGMYVCHTCDVRACVRPEHLWLGTATDNNRDTFRKRRRVNGAGEQSPVAKLSDDVLVDAYRRYMRGEATIYRMCRELGVRANTLSYAFQGRTWRHLVPRFEDVVLGFDL